MDSLVLELQKEALDPKISVANLLRKALVVARKLNIEEIQGWIELELNGYGKQSDYPEYRVVTGEVQVWNPVRYEWQPVIFGNAEIGERFSQREIMNSVGEIEKTVGEDEKAGELTMSFSKSTENALMQATGAPTPPTFIMTRGQLYGILESVRNAVLAWALDLEKNGVLGEGMTFSAKEKTTTGQTTYNIGTYIDKMDQSQIQQDTLNSIQSLSVSQLDLEKIEELIEALGVNIEQIGVDNDRMSELVADVQTIKAQLSGSNPKPSIIRESLRSIRTVLEGAASSVLANEWITRVNSVLGL